jgi:hypothetical protein
MSDPFEGIFFNNGRYKKEFEETKTPIGRGSCGVVFKARNKINGEYYAIKKFRISSK